MINKYLLVFRYMTKAQYKTKKVKQMISLLPQPQQYYHNLLISDNANEGQLSTLNKWIEVYCNTKNGGIYTNFSLIALAISVTNSPYQKSKNWRRWSFNLLGNMYSTKIKQQMKINSSDYQKLYQSVCSKNTAGNDIQNLQQYIREYKEPIVTEFMVTCISSSYKNQIKRTHHKQKQTRSKNRYFSFINDQIKHIKSLQGLQLIVYDLIDVHNEKKIQQRFLKHSILSQIEEKTIQVFSVESISISHNQKNLQTFFYKLLQLYDLNHYIPNPKSFDIINQCLINFIDKDMETLSDPLKKFMMIFRHYPFWIQYIDRKVVYHRKNIFQAFNQKLQKTHLLQKYQTYHGKSIEIYTILIANTYLYETYMKLKTSTIDGFLIIAEKPSPPVIDEFYWRVYHSIAKNQPLVNQFLINLFKDHYQKQLQLPESEFQISEERPTIYEQYIGNEADALIYGILCKLNFKIQKQIKVNGIMVDYLIDDQIIVECDGDSHLLTNKIEIDQKTAVRNVVHMINGYKVVSISILQINKYRDELDRLSELVNTKIQLAKKQGIYYVQ